MNVGVEFSVLHHAAWAPGIDSAADWSAWADGKLAIGGSSEPPLRDIPPMLRRRAGGLAKMALEAAQRCFGDRRDLPIVFCSRHGEADRAVSLLTDLAKSEPLSPTSFALSVHNAAGGLFSIARADRSNHVALAAGDSTLEHGVIEACGLLACGEPAVVLVAYDNPLPPLYRRFQDCCEQPFAWSWLIGPAAKHNIRLAWTPAPSDTEQSAERLPGALAILRFYLRAERTLERCSDRRRWIWSRDV